MFPPTWGNETDGPVRIGRRCVQERSTGVWGKKKKKMLVGLKSQFVFKYIFCFLLLNEWLSLQSKQQHNTAVMTSLISGSGGSYLQCVSANPGWFSYLVLV